MSSRFKTVWLLALVNAIALSAIPMMMLIGSIIGTELAPGERWATLPITAMVIGTALGVTPAARLMAAAGRRSGFFTFVCIGIAACGVLGLALEWRSFTVFCIGALLLGTTAAALQQIRFAAMESVPLEDGPTAASIILCAGIVAAFLGPELALWGESLTEVQYQGSYWLGSLCLLAGGSLLFFYRPARIEQQATVSGGRSIVELLRSPTILLAIVSGASAYMVMSFVMTATPISMHVHHGHSMVDTKWVLQSHIAAMFLPSLFTAWLFRLVGIRGLMLAGLACYVCTIAIGLVDASLLGFWGQLVMLGVGWNFLFVAGTALLPMGYREGEQYRGQALNDSVVFSSQAAASLSAGWAISAVSWQSLLLFCLLPMALLALLLAAGRQQTLGHEPTG